MKKIILAIAVVASLAGTAQAEAHGWNGGGYHGNTTVVNNYGGYRGGYYGGGNGWGVAGAVVGAMAVGAVINAATQPVYYPPQPVYAPQPQVIYQQVPAYGPPVQVSCVPAYTAQGQYLGCMR